MSPKSAAIWVHFGEEVDLSLYDVQYGDHRVKNVHSGRMVTAWVADLRPTDASMVASQGVMLVKRGAHTPLASDKGFVGTTSHGVPLYSSQKAAARALYLDMFFNCTGEDMFRRRRRYLCQQMVRHFENNCVYRPKSDGYSVFPFFENMSRDEWPLFFYVSKGKEAFLLYRDQEDCLQKMTI